MKFGVREICDVVFKATANTKVGNTEFFKGEPVLYIDTAKTSTLESAATTVYAQGGKGNSRLLAWEGEKTLTFTVEDAMLSPLGFSVLTGAGLLDATAGKPLQVHNTVEVIAGVGGAVKIDGDALGLTGTETAQVYLDDDVPIFGTSIDDSGAAITTLGIGDPGVATGAITANAATTPTAVTLTFDPAPTEGDKVRLDFYVTKETGATELTIDPGKFGGYYYVEASTLFRDQSSGEDLAAEIVLPKVKIQSNFTFAMASTGDPSTFKFVMDAFPAPTTFSNEKVLCAIQILDPTPAG